MEEFSKKRELAIAEMERKRTEVHALVPGVFEIDRKLSATCPEIAMAALSGEGYEEKIAAIKAENTKLRCERAELLKAAGYPEDYTEVRFDCPLCNDTGFVGINMCSCLKKIVAMGAFSDSGIGELVKKQSFENFSFEFYQGESLIYAKNNCETLKNFADNFNRANGKNFILVGETGLGKTHLSTSVAKVLIEKGFNVAYDTVNEIMSDFEAQKFRGTVSEDDIRKRYYESDLLIIDDLGCEIANQFTVSVVYNLINTRINNGLSTMINTNLSQIELREKYSGRITSRIFGEFHPLLFTGNDIRSQKLKMMQKKT